MEETIVLPGLAEIEESQNVGELVVLLRLLKYRLRDVEDRLQYLGQRAAVEQIRKDLA